MADIDLARLQGDPTVEAVLGELCAATGMGFAAVARVTESAWIACQVLDKIEFGLEAGGELQIATTICNEIREHKRPIFIANVDAEPIWRVHPTPILYGFQSYISYPLVMADGRFFGTLCAIDPAPNDIDNETTRALVEGLASRLLDILNQNPVRR